MWINSQENPKIGDLLFLIEIIDFNKGGTVTWHGTAAPGRTNISREAKIRGWLGETDNVSSYAHGAVIVTAHSKRESSRHRVRKTAVPPALAEELGIKATGDSANTAGPHDRYVYVDDDGEQY